MERLLAKLVLFRTLTGDNKENQRALDWVAQQIAPYLRVRRFSDAGVPSLVATARATQSPTLWLAAHMDIVPASDKLFRLRKQKGAFIGRGTYDMKFAITCYIRFVQELKERARDYNFGIMLTCDEEAGGFHGTSYLLKKGFRGKFVLLPDGGENWRIAAKAKAVWDLYAEARGVSAHGSRPWEGKNAIHNLVSFLADLEKLFPAARARGKKISYQNSINLGKIAGGNAINQVPNRAQAWIDIRHTPEEKRADLWKKIRRVAAQHPSVRIRTLVYGSASSTDLALPPVRAFRQIAQELFNIRIGVTADHGSSDARFFADRHIPTLLVSPRGGGSHTEKEWIDARDLEHYYHVMKKWVLGFNSNQQHY